MVPDSLEKGLPRSLTLDRPKIRPVDCCQRQALELVMSDDEDPARRIIKRDLKALQSQRNLLRLADPLHDIRKVLEPTNELRKTLKRLASPGLELQKTLKALDLPRLNWVQQADRWKGISTQLPVITELERANRGWLEIAKAVRSPFAETALRLKPLFDEFNRHESVCESLERVGWLPHYTTPFDELEDLGDAQVEEILDRHYVDGWPAIRTAISVGGPQRVKGSLRLSR